MHPGTLGADDVLRDLMRATPIAAAFVPQRPQGGGQTGGRRGLVERFFERQDIHTETVASAVRPSVCQERTGAGLACDRGSRLSGVPGPSLLGPFDRNVESAA